MRSNPALALVFAVAITLPSGCLGEPEEIVIVNCAEADVSKLPFDPDELERSIRGEHESTIRWTGPGSLDRPEEERVEPLVVEVTKRSERVETLHCGGLIEFDVDVEVRVADERQATFRGRATGSEDGTLILAEAGKSVAKDLSIAGPEVLGAGFPHYGLNFWIDADGARGSLQSVSDTAGQCERARWPAERRCSIVDREDLFDTQFGEFTFEQVLEQLEQLEPQDIRWNDGSESEIELRFERADFPLCVGPVNSDRADPRYRGRELRSMLTAHLTTEDGRIDSSFPVRASVRWSERRGLLEIPRGASYEIDHTISLTADTARAGTELFDPELAPKAGTEPNVFQAVYFYATVGRDGVRGLVELSTVELDVDKPAIAMSPALEQGDLDGVCARGASKRTLATSAGFGVGAIPRR